MDNEEDAPAQINLSNGYTGLSIERWPDRKLPTLCHNQGARVNVLATFKSETAATWFTKFIESLAGCTIQDPQTSRGEKK